MKIWPALLSVAVAAGAAIAIQSLPAENTPEAAARALSEQLRPDTAKVAGLYTQALLRDSANPFRWADLGDALAANHQLPEARTCFRRALELNRRLPQIWLRDANFHFMQGEVDEAVGSAVLVLKTVPDYDGVLFNYFDLLVGNTDRVLNRIGDNRRAAVAYVDHLIDTSQTDAAIAAWRRVFRSGWIDQRTVGSYVDLLLRQRRYEAAANDWAAFTHRREDDPNAVFNGSFEEDPFGSALDWRISKSADFDTEIESDAAHDGKRALHIVFSGKANVAYAHVSEEVIVRPGRYRFSAWVRAEKITTNEGPRLEVCDPQNLSRLDVKTGPYLGSFGWTHVDQEFTLPPDVNMVEIRVLRTPSGKFDNKIDGEFWLDSVELVRE